jgi:NAD(P)-dependent dehydrogenase (short-subunit alcohol dehydrogenase family)
MGACAAVEFAKEGADVVCVSKGRKDAATGKITNVDMDKVVAEIKALGRKSIGIMADVSKSAEVKSAVAQAIAEFGQIDILVNNAGIILNSPIIYTPEESINAIIDVNLKGCIYCCKYVVPHMARRNYGKIINISSGAGLYAEPNYTAYSASKYGVLGLTESLAAEVSHYYINVNAVCPGAVLTPMLRNALSLRFPGKDPDEEFQKRLDGQFFHREVTDKDIANTVMFLASEDARNITSQWIAVTAGKEKKQPAAKPYFILPPEGQEIE